MGKCHDLNILLYVSFQELHSTATITVNCNCNTSNGDIKRNTKYNNIPIKPVGVEFAVEVLAMKQLDMLLVLLNSVQL